jgi:signal transduction histidine kinase
VRTRQREFPLLWVTALCGIAILLFTVAFLQYRWNNQIKQATEVRMGSELESVMMKWQLDLYGEFSTICVALQVGPDSGARDSWEDYLGRYRDWARASARADSVENIYSNRDLVKDIYIWQTSQPQTPRLLRLDADVGTIKEASTPHDLRALLSHLQNHSTNLQTALRAWESNSPPIEGQKSEEELSRDNRLRSNAITGWQFDENIPAIVHPILQPKQDLSRPRTVSNVDPVDWVVIVLNFDIIRSRIFPQLTRRYFDAGQGLDYKLAVVTAGKGGNLLYSSDPEFGIPQVSGFDSAMNIFGPPPESTEGSFWQTLKNSKSVRGEEWHSFSSPVWFPVIRATSSGAPWILFLQHRQEPFEATINRVWRSNLVTGGVVLLLLAITMVLVVIASQNAQNLANLQMDFVASISHELRTPLAAILSAGQNISDGYVQSLPVYGSIITTQARQLIDLVDQILLFASMKSGKKAYSVRPLPVGELIGQVRRNSSVLFRNSGFTFDFQTQEGLPLVWGDLQALSHCLQNLIGNAVKYSGKSRWIGITADLCEYGPTRREVRISVTDHGLGIDAADLQRIFEPFYRGPRILAAQIHGTGLGLSVAKHIADAMGGSVSVTSEINIGSVFTLHLRIAEGFDPNTVAGMARTVTIR